MVTPFQSGHSLRHTVRVEYFFLLHGFICYILPNSLQNSNGLKVKTQ
jgi:hypothetical protein